MRLAAILPLIACALAQDRVAPALPPSGSVALTLEEYNHLTELAAKPSRPPEVPPIPAAVQHADLKLSVSGERATGTAVLDGEVFNKGFAVVPLLSGITVLDAQQKGKDLPLKLEGNTHSAVLPGPGAFSVSLDIGLQVALEAGRATLRLHAPAASAVRLTLSIPGDHTNVSLNPGQITSRSSNAGVTVIEATLVPGVPVSIWWATRESAPAPAPREARFLADLKSLVSVSEAQLTVAVLADITVLQGEPADFTFRIPEGFELTTATGATLDSLDTRPTSLRLIVTSPAQRSHQFLIQLEKAAQDGKAQAPLLSLAGSQRETGEVLVETDGTMELTAAESGALKRMDLREVNPYLRALARHSLQAAFRYHRQSSDAAGLALEWVRFPGGPLPAALAQNATVTTLVTSEGRSLTEVRLSLRNQSQPFLRVSLPPGASILSADVAGERVKPVEGADGSRVPLLRPGFRPVASYPVSFVFLHAGAPFAKKGASEISLPKFDIPISLLQWEVFLPEQYKVRDFGGDATPSFLLPMSAIDAEAEKEPVTILIGATMTPGQIGGTVFDPAEGVIPSAKVIVTHLPTNSTRTAVTDTNGRWVVAGVPAGRVRLSVSLRGFKSLVRDFDYDPQRPLQVTTRLDIGAVDESVVVSAEKDERRNRKAPPPPPAASPDTGASANVMNLQKRVAGVLPIPIDVPRAGASYRFIRPIVVEEETRITFQYKSK